MTKTTTNSKRYKTVEWNVGIYEVVDPEGNVLAAYPNKDTADDLCGHLNSKKRLDVA